MGKKQGMIGAAGDGAAVRAAMLGNLRRPGHFTEASAAAGSFPKHNGPGGPTYAEPVVPLDVEPIAVEPVGVPLQSFDVECASCGNTGHTGFTVEGKCLRCSSYAMRSVVVEQVRDERIFGAHCPHCQAAQSLVDYLSATLMDAEAELAELRAKIDRTE